MENFKKPILVIEDDLEYQHLMRVVLEPHFQLTFCDDPDAALALLKTSAPALVLLDLNLGGKYGFDLLENASHLGINESIPFVVCSSEFTPATKERAQSLGARGFLPKPFNLDFLLTMAKSLTGQH